MRPGHHLSYSEAVATLRTGAVVAAGCLLAVADVPEGVRPFQPWAGLAGLLAVGALVCRRSLLALFCGACLVAVLAVSVLAELSGEPGQLGFGHVLVVALALARLARHAEIARSAPIGLLALTTAVVTEGLADDRSIGDVAFTAVVWGLGLTAGLALRWRGQATAARAERVRSAERERIARDLHDVVAHHVSAIAMTAEGARSSLGRDDEATDRSLAAIHDAARTTLDEMRRMVHVLRDGRQDAPVSLTTIADSLASGDGTPPVRVELVEPVIEPPVAHAAALFRIAQESVTNARRHADQATRIDVEIVSEPTVCSITISDDGRTPVRSRIGSGYGIDGMSERASLLGGTLAAGPDPRGGWRVVASLPVTP